jgi:PAS domain S-box-containing protein
MIPQRNDLARSGAEEPHWTEIADAVPGLVLVLDTEGNAVFACSRWSRYAGPKPGAALGAGWLDCLHPGDRAVVEAALRRSVRELTPFDETFRLRGEDGEPRWFRFRAERDGPADGRPVRWVAVGFDVHARLVADQRRELLLAELGHRAKNLMAMVQAMAELTSRAVSDPAEFRQAFSGRLHALGRSYDGLLAADWAGLDLHALIAEEIAPFGLQVAGRCSLSGPAVRLPATRAMSLALILHELLTNALKYGALSTQAGAIGICWSLNGEQVRLTWTETGGPPVTAPTTKGFGTRLIETVAARELTGPAEISYAPQGLCCAFTFSIA